MPGPTHIDLTYADGTTQRFIPQPAPPVQAKRSLIGVNLDGIASSSPQFPFVDAMKSARRWGSYAKPEDQAGPVDADGYPTADSGGVVVMEDTGCDVGGDYLLIWERQTTWEGARGEQIAPAAITATGFAAYIKVPAGATRLWLRYKGGCPGKVKLIRPGYATDAKVFTEDLMAALLPFGTIRFMDWLKTNSLVSKSFADRAQGADQTYATRGVPLEVCCDLCNALGADMWWNVPVLWSDVDVADAAALIDSRLKAGLSVYVEFGNELWNTAPAFKPQYDMNFSIAAAEYAAGDVALGEPEKPANGYYVAWRRVAKRACQIRRVLWNDPRFRVVLASQVGNPTVATKQLEYVARAWGEPKQFFYGLAGAPYLALPKSMQSNATLTPQQYADGLLSNVAGAINSTGVQSFRALADKYGLKMLGYEGGIHDVNLACGQSVVDGQSLATIGQAVEQYLAGWTGDVFCWFTLASKWTARYGVWGLTNDIRKLDAPKYQAAKRVAEARMR